MRTVVAGLACLPLLACIDRSLSELPSTPDTVEKKTVAISLNNELDLLFVVDNSGSMLAEHQSLESRFPELIRALDELGPRRPDLHIGVVTSDMGTGRVDTGEACSHSDGGRMQGGHCPALGGATFLSDVVGPDGTRVTNYTGTLDAAFACMADVGTDGCGFEQHLASMKAALSPKVNPGFLRKSANLGVVILADEDDCSTEDDRLFARDPASGPDPVLGPFSDFRCFEHGVTCDPVADPRAPGVRTGCVPREDSPYLFEIEQYIEFLGGLKDRADQVFVAAIVGDPGHVEVVPASGNRAGLAPGCTGGLGSAAPAIRLAGLIDAFPGQSHRETICTGDLGAALRNIGESLPPPPACFARPPIDQDLITPGMQAECSVVEVTDPDGPNRRENPLAACRAGGQHPCWQIVADPQCTQTAEHWRIDVDRAGVPGPAGGNLEVQCVVSIPVPPPV